MGGRGGLAELVDARNKHMMKNETKYKFESGGWVGGWMGGRGSDLTQGETN